MTNADTLAAAAAEARTPIVAAVLDLVRSTGKSPNAHSVAVAVAFGVSPREVQTQVDLYMYATGAQKRAQSYIRSTEGTYYGPRLPQARELCALGMTGLASYCGPMVTHSGLRSLPSIPGVRAGSRSVPSPADLD